ncbi:MAG TPA: alpha/beta hydrolase [Bryobacteraceae bacterium]
MALTSIGTVRAAVVLWITVASVWAGGLEGAWKGTWTKNGDSLPVTVTFVNATSGYSGSFDSDPLQVTGIPFSHVEETSGRVRFLLQSDDSITVFDGLLKGDSISGTLTEGNVKGVFEMTRGVPAAVGIRERDVTFSNGGVTLAGTLLLPETPRRHSAALFLQGSGAEGRWANHYLARKFAESGIAALIYDKRGAGKSTGDWKTAGFDALAEDASAGVRFLRSLPEVDAGRVGIYGHSQGGTFAPLVASRLGNLRFVIASAASGISPADCEIYSVDHSIGLSRLPPAERSDAEGYVRELVHVAYRNRDHTALDAMAEKFRGRSWFFAPPAPDNSFWTIARLTAQFDPLKYWRQVRVPVLLLYGGHDERVPPVQSAEAIQEALRKTGNRQVTVKTFANADHTFAIVDPPHRGGWSRHVPDYAEVLTNWVLSLK